MKDDESKHLNEEPGKSNAAFISGLNDNLDFLGKLLHIQTEHSAYPTAHIVTQVFCGGRVMLSKKSDYPPGVCESHDFGRIQQLMKTQHCQVIQEIRDKQARKQGAH